MALHPDLEAILAADEESRAHVAAATRTAEAAIAAARETADRRDAERRARAEVRVSEALQRIEAETSAEVEARRRRRDEWRAVHESRAEALFARAAEVFAAIVRDGARR